MSERVIRIKYVKSCIGKPERQRRTLEALGLRHLGDEVEVRPSSALLGMLSRVSHLVEMVES